jgi:hypothetical protein
MKPMLKKTLVLLGLACLISCRVYHPDLQPPLGPHFRSLSIKFSFHAGSSLQNGRVFWRFDENSSKFIFFTPLNQVGLELDVAGEEAVLVNFGKKTFWRGDFSLMLDRLWGIGLTLSALRSLLLAGEAPAAEFLKKGIVVSLERAGGNGAPSTAYLQRNGAKLTLRILKSELRPGRIVLVDYAARYRAEDLENVLNDD